jgi:UDP-3-O-[3-hydroxymyristoyl] glucosamine N-acyltransferase
MTLGELIEKLGGRIAYGDPETEVLQVTSPEEANGTDLVFAENAVSAALALDCGAGAVVLKSGLVPEVAPAKPRLGVVETANSRLWFAKAARLLELVPSSAGIHPSAFIGEYVRVGEDVSIGPGVVVEEHACIGKGTRIEPGAVIGRYSTIGEDCHIHARVTICRGTKIGNRVVVYPGAVLGADGFGYVRDAATGAYTQFPQRSYLLIDDDVEIGANSTIDRGALQRTHIRRGTKIDNLVHIGHNCDIGEDVIIVSGTGISGSSTVGNGAVLAGQVGIGDHAHIGPGVILGGQAGVLSGKTVTNEGLRPGTVLWGTPARPLPQVLREIAAVSRLARRRRKSANGEIAEK